MKLFFAFLGVILVLCLAKTILAAIGNAVIALFKGIGHGFKGVVNLWAESKKEVYEKELAKIDEEFVMDLQLTFMKWQVWHGHSVRSLWNTLSSHKTPDPEWQAAAKRFKVIRYNTNKAYAELLANHEYARRALAQRYGQVYDDRVS